MIEHMQQTTYNIQHTHTCATAVIILDPPDPPIAIIVPSLSTIIGYTQYDIVNARNVKHTHTHYIQSLMIMASFLLV
jgi:chemotaxis signal transduction protein